MLLSSVVLMVAFMVTTSLLIYGPYENSQGVSNTLPGSIIVTYNNTDQLFSSIVAGVD